MKRSRVRLGAALALFSTMTLVVGGAGAARAQTQPPVLKTWGWNAYGQLADDQFNDVAIPRPSQLRDLRQVSPGGDHGLAVTQAGTVVAWGHNGEGELGIGTFGAPEPSPVAVADLTRVVAVSAGGAFSMALRADGSVWTWGWNDDGQLGLGDFTTRNLPARVQLPHRAVAIAAGSYHALALLNDGTVWQWGDIVGKDRLSYEQPTPVRGDRVDHVVAIEAGFGVSFAIRDDGTLWVWGGGGWTTGDGHDRSHPYAIQVPGLTNIVKVSAGDTVLALDASGTVWAWGPHSIGDGRYIGSKTATKVAAISGAIDIAAGGNCNYALRADGRLWSWGWSYAGCLGNGGIETYQEIPKIIPHLFHITAIHARAFAIAVPEGATG